MSTPSASKKDVIYVDIEDDITSIIDKVKGAHAPIVALVPPKRIGVLQSVVNLKLLQRAANSADKRVVLITSDNALSALAAGVAIPVAKNLQSKPEVPEVIAPDADNEDVINGDELPVGDLAATAPLASAAIGKGKTTPITSASTAAANAPKKGSKLPDFDTFRKKLFLIIGGSVALIVFVVWAIVFAPHATVAITANTNLLNIDQVLQLKPNATADTTQNVLPVTVKQTKKTISADFEATGKKNVGEKATGTVSFENNDGSPVNIPAGTKATTSAGFVFTTNTAVTVPKATLTFGIECGADHLCPGTASSGVTATEGGTSYNGASGSVSGSFGGASAAFTSPASGGTDKTATVVTQADIDKAKQQLQSQDANAIKTDLKKQFDSDMIVIDESFKADAGEPASSPAIDQEATKAKLTAETTYTLVGVKRSQLKANFDAYLKTQLTGKQDQKIYDSGDGSVSFSQFTPVEGGYNAKVTAQAQVGPKIDEKALKTQLVGKRVGEIQQELETISGIEDVKTSLSPFWVTTAPGADKITIKFVLKNGSN